MKSTLWGLALLLCALPLAAQHPLRVLVRDARTQQPAPGITVAIPSLKTGAATDTAGRTTLPNLPAGAVQVRVSGLGYQPQTLPFTLPQTDSVAVIQLEPTAEELESVVVEATRSNSRIEDVPVRVEVLGAEELAEKTSMRATNISMVLTEASGIQPQFTSASAGSVAFRIQGLDGRYTQILRDGFPLYGGFSQGLSLVQIPPLDLRQVEVVKGASSALYGGDAIAGLVNLVTKTPTATPTLNLLLNQTHKGGRDLTAFYAGRNGRLGLTLLVAQSTQQPRDVDGDGYTDLPQLQLSNFNPRLYYYLSDSTTLYAGLNTTLETRTGGSLAALDNPALAPGRYLERNRSERYSTQLRADTRRGGRLLTFKNTVSSFRRDLTAGAAAFAGRQVSSYTEASALLPWGRHRPVLGANVLTDDFQETPAPGAPGRDYSYRTLGVFGQDDWRATDRLTVQAGLRADFQRPYGAFVLPRVSAIFKPVPSVALRAGGGFGYKAPTVFTSLTEQRAYVGVLPPDPARTRAETSRGLNADLNLRGLLLGGRLGVAFNQAVFYTQLNDALIPDPQQYAQGLVVLVNAPTPVTARGLETNLRLDLDALRLFAAYTLTDTRQTYDLAQPAPLPFVSRHRVVLTAAYERPQRLRLALEATYNGPQYLGEGLRQGRSFWLLGALAERTFAPHWSVVLNLENFLDARQTRYEAVVSGPVSQPVFRPLYAPLDGFVGNVAVRFGL